MDRYNKYVGAGKYQMPVVPKPEITKEELPIKWFNFKDSKSNYMDGFDESECGLHFFIGDERFDAVWKWPEKYIEHVRRFKCVLAPDFSLYTDWPKAIQIYNTYRKQYVARMWADAGIKVIPTVSWSTPDSHLWCFDGIQHKSIVAVSSVGCQKSLMSKLYFEKGMDAMLEQIEPELIVWRGKVPRKYEDLPIQIDESGSPFLKKRYTTKEELI